ncbi:GntR family transcriptional regulator [Streptomyces sp. NPDC046862]|uniref:GntR family transcriptional regulator n=1 Tax=Streptomyces sp. NPDC046862 TaxID=3154603 RepID=UPI003456D77B
MTGLLPKGRLPDGQTALYRFYAADGKLLYVGITQDLETRWKSHQRDKIWWIDVARKEYVILKNRSAADQVERTAIRTEHPRYDRTRPGHTTAAGELLYKRPLNDPYQEGIVARAERAIKADLESDRIPSWSLLPTESVLAEQHRTSRAAVDHALSRLSADGLLVAVKHQYVNAPRAGFPQVSAFQHGPHYVLAAHHFGQESFTADDLAPYVPHSRTMVLQNLSRLCKHGLARCVARKPVGRYVLTEMPEPDPVRLEPATRQDVAQMEEWLVGQINADQKAETDPQTLSRLERDRWVVEACTDEIVGFIGHRSSEVLAEMAYFYAQRPGYQDVWKPQRLGGPKKPTR